MKSLAHKILIKSYSLIENGLFKRFTFFTKKNTLLIVKPDSIGDYILFRNFLEVVRTSETYKDHIITLCGNSWWKTLSEQLDNTFVDEFIWIDYNKMPDPFYRFSFYKHIFFQRFETVLHPVYSRDSVGDGIVLHSGAKSRIGNTGDALNLTVEQKENNDRYYTQLIPSTPAPVFEFERNREFFQEVLKKEIPIERPSIASAKASQKKIIFFPGAKDDFRRWSTQKIAQLGEHLKNEYPAFDLYIGGSMQDQHLAMEIIRQSTAAFTNSTGKYTLPELLDFIADAALIMGNVSGPFHMATALGKKVIAVSNGKNYSRFSPYPAYMHTKSVVVYPKQVMDYPEPERIKKFRREVKEIDINEISVEDVYTIAKQLLAD